MFTSVKVTLLLFGVLSFCSALVEKRASLPPRFTSKIIGNATGLFRDCFRDGGGGGKVGGYNIINFSDDTCTTGGYALPKGANTKGGGSNSIILTNFNGGGPDSSADFGANGIPRQQVPTFPSEDSNNVRIWPNANIATACGGQCGISFYPVILNGQYAYSTGVNITVTGFGPVVTRPVQSLFGPNEVGYGTFSSFVGIDGYLYLFGNIDATAHANGLKMARVPSGSPFDRGQYQYWNGAAWSRTMPARDDGGTANIWNQSWTDLNGNTHGPPTGDVFYNAYYGVYMIIYQLVGIDARVYMVYSSNIAGGWSQPVVLLETPEVSNYNYAIHAYPNYDTSGRVIPISFIQQAHCELLGSLISSC